MLLCYYVIMLLYYYIIMILYYSDVIMLISHFFGITWVKPWQLHRTVNDNECIRCPPGLTTAFMAAEKLADCALAKPASRLCHSFSG